VKKPTAKKPIAKKSGALPGSTRPLFLLPPAPFWNRWTFRVLVGGVVAVVIGAYTMVNLPAICPPGTVICHHGPGTVTLDHDLFANVGRVLGMEGEGNVSVSHTEVQNAPIP
jgi:hypothetical protein